MTAHYLSVNQAMRLARTHTNRGALAEAKRAYRWILEKVPDNKGARDALDALQEPTAEERLPQDATEAMALVRQGRLEEARKQACELVERHPRDAMVHNLLGDIELALGQTLRAIGSFRRASAMQPDFLEARLSLGKALAEIGRNDEAIDCFTKVVSELPDSLEALDLLGKAMHAAGRHKEAAESHKRALALDPGSPKGHAGLGQAQMSLGEIEDAARNFARAARSDPSSGKAHARLGAALTELGRASDGIRACRKAIELSPGDAQVHVDMATALDGLGETDEAIDSLRSALVMQKDHVGAHSDICGLYERTKQFGEFRFSVKRAQKECGTTDPRIRFRTAQLAEHDNCPNTAGTILEKLPQTELAPPMAAGRLKLLGKLSEQRGEHDIAFDLVRQANEIMKQTPLAKNLEAANYIRKVEELTASFSAPEVKPWTDALEADGATPVFMVGFPGAGPCFIDALIGEHPDITVVEDKPMVQRMRAMIEGTADCDALETLSPESIQAMRQAYYAELHRQAGGTGISSVIVDKRPLNIVHAGLINRVFPSAKFLFTDRHPATNVLSCYMKDFRLDEATANFLDLESTATLYDRVMRLWSAYRNLLQLDVHSLPCEIAALDRREATRALLRFLELDPAYPLIERELPRPLNWEDFSPHLEPVLPLLDSWARQTET